MNNVFDFKEILSVTVILFSILDIVGSIPIVINFKRTVESINYVGVTIATGVLLMLYLFVGQFILEAFRIDYSSFAMAGGFVLFLIGSEMLIGIQIFKHDGFQARKSAIVPLAFPLYAGAGSMTSLISLSHEFSKINIVTAILINLVLLFMVLRLSAKIERLLGASGILFLRKFFGVLLIAIAIKIIRSNIANF